jgi:dTDP-4-dehydrorhamnose 3,5-epimerase
MKYKTEIDGVVIRSIPKNEDNRGFLFELFRDDELKSEHQPVMAYISWTKPNVTRGPHEHHDQTDLFCFVGPGEFELHLWDNKSQFPLNDPVDSKWIDRTESHEVHLVGESNPVSVLVPPGVVHGYKCISEKDGLVFNAPNQLYAGPGKKYPVDEIRHEHENDSKFKID